ncbi:T9SS type A sorting domain-containing protein [Flavobacterium sp. MC2016-06]|jgi:uncharacterized protein (DUF2141 family)|uniref:T9SS type A sorting domain-containing protein n=1 Tax=Flavobacterium sp. MC2016-06 TaxID=2676308 RepID=UPI0012BAA1AF|nr:T9SS type A sorting domain-containing protein [Flavobacterium sp. MC2016-06]MBU3859550.1 T9SS type A sorting domain-containing protein [Flavobacterium sp. MC2016-06]
MKKTLLCFLFLLSNLFYAQVNDIEHCAGDTNFNLNLNKPLLLGNLNPAETTISYHLSLDDANNNANAIAAPNQYASSTGSKTIYARIDNNGTITTNYFNLVLYAPLAVSIETKTITCKDETGSINATASGGKAPFVYSLNGQSLPGTNSYNNLVAGYYNVSVTDALGCTAMVDTFLSQPTPISIIPLIEDKNITIIANGGTYPYQYSLDGINYQASYIFSNLAPGSYTVYVKDTNECFATQNDIVISAPAPLAVIATASAINCFGATSTITVTATGGTPPYSYSINNGVNYTSSNVFNYLPAGTYAIKVKDAQNFEAPTQIAINTPSALVTSAVITKPLDCVSNATLRVMSSGGIAPYVYSINGSPYQAANVFSNLTAGVYIINTRDAGNCDVTNSIVVAPLINLTATVTHTKISQCSSTPVSTITVNAAGGIAPYQYSLNNGITYQSSNLFTNIYAGSYTIRIRDAGNCIYTTQLIVEPATPLVMTTAITKPLECNGNGAIAAVTAIGGNPPYIYSIGNGYQTSNVFSGLFAGDYQITVTDNQGCMISMSQKIAPPEPLIATINTNNATCYGSASGKITAAVSGGTAPYLYSLNGSSFSTNNVFASLEAGNYIITIKDAANCDRSFVAAVSQPDAPLVMSLDIKTINNDGQIGGTIFAGASGGTAPYKYSLRNNDTGSIIADNSSVKVFKGMLAGSYTMSVTDANGCKAENNNLILSLANPIILNTVKTPITCQNNTASLTINPSGGVPPYLYSYDNGSTFTSSNPGLSNLTAGTYSILMEDAIGNEAQAHIIVKPYIPVTMTANVSYDTNNGQIGGVVKVNPAGGTAPYYYTLKKSATGEIMFEDLTAIIYNGLPTGNYSITVKDANGCKSENVDVAIVLPTPILINAVNSTPLSCTNSTATMTINASGGTAPYQYSYDSGKTYSTNNTVNLAAGNTNFYVKDALGNIGWISYDLKPYTNVSMKTVTTHISCNGAQNGMIEISVNSGGTAPYTYSLGNGYSTTNIFTNLSIGQYTASVKDAAGCISSIKLSVTQPAVLVLNTTVVNSTTPFITDGKITITPSGGVLPYLFAIKDQNDVLLSPPKNSNVFAGLPMGTYSAIITDSRGCTATKTGITVSSTALFATAVTIPITCTSVAPSITINAVGGSKPYSYSFNNGANYSSSNVVTGIIPGNYAMKVRDAQGRIFSLSTVLAPLDPITVTTALVSPVKCYGSNDAVIQVIPVGGKAPYLYSFNLGPFQSSATFTNLFPGTFMIRVKDSNECISNMTYTISQPAVLASTAAVEYETITVNATGGTAPYTYTLQDYYGTSIGSPQTSNVFNDLPGGVYNIIINDSRNCTSLQQNIIIPETTPLNLATSETPATCYTPTGTVTAYAVGGNPPYQYSFDNGATYTTSNTAVLNPGPYVARVKDAKGTIAFASLTIGAAIPPSITAQYISNVTCFGNNNGSVIVNTSGGKAPFTYSLDDLIYQEGNVFNNLKAGDYTITVKDSYACKSIVSVRISQPNQLTSTAVVTNNTITVNANGGTAPYIYSLGNSNGVPIIGYQTSNVFNNLSSGVYIVKIIDSSNCEFSPGAITIVKQPALSATYTATSATCNAGATITINATGGTTPYQYSLDNGATYRSTNVFTNLYPGNYMIMVRDAQNITTSMQAVINQVSAPVITAQIINTIRCYGDSSGVIRVMAMGGQAPYLYSINGSPFQSNDTFSNLNAGTYNTTVKDANGCMSIVTNTISQPVSPLTAVINVQNQTATINAQGGTGTIMFAISPGLYEFSNNNTFSDLVPGVYQIMARDENGCIVMFYISIDPPAPIVEGESENAIVYEFKLGQTLAAITVEGENIKWYSSQNTPTNKTLETALPLSTILVNGTTYYASQTINGIESKNRLAVTAKLNGSLSTPDFALSGFKFYPNPVKNILTVNHTSVIDEVQIFTVSGESVLFKKINSTHSEIDLSHLSTGVYLLNVKSDGKEKSMKIIKE